ncbi:MAG TPA: carboxymuconolactone decarboxylase family protein [bacterium]|nr:carboxymuconolactone decarboxylase family protein [bacterium]
MQARMKNPALVLQGVNAGIQAMMAPIFQSGIAKTTLDIVGLRVGQMNNCELCIGQAMNAADQDVDMRERLLAVVAWRESDRFTAAERSALFLCEAVTELKARYDSVPDSLWREVEQYYDESSRAALVLFICAMNMFTRINVCTRQTTPNWEQ